MTTCNLLAEKSQNKLTISAWEKTEKFSSTPRYEIVISDGDMVREVLQAARTTWRRKFKELI